MSNLPSFRPAALPPVPNLSKQGLLLPSPPPPAPRQVARKTATKSNARSAPETTDAVFQRLWANYHQDKFLTPPAIDERKKRRGALFTEMTEFFVVPLGGEEEVNEFVAYCATKRSRYSFVSSGKWHGGTEKERRTQSVIAAVPRSV